MLYEINISEEIPTAIKREEEIISLVKHMTTTSDIVSDSVSSDERKITE